MITVKRHRRELFMLLAVSLALAEPTVGDDEAPAWLQWGGPNRNFSAPAEGLALSWPGNGPRQLWRRELGEGNSAILAEHGRLYTMARVDGMEVVICLDAKTGETVWEHRYPQQPHNKHIRQFGEGPGSTPLIVDDLLFTIGIAGKMHALNKLNGGVVWSHDLWGEGFDGERLGFGYTSSPVAYRDTVIVPVGGETSSLVAFEQRSGSVRWKALSFRNSYSSPGIMNVLGEPQLVVFMAEELIGVAPGDGQLRWHYPHVNQWKHNISMPLAAGGDTIFLSSPQAGARGLRLVPDGTTIHVEEAWSTRRVQFYHGSSVRIGDWIYGSSGTAIAFMTAINIHTGEVGWRKRGFAKANCVEADGKLVILDEDGMLYLATASPEKLIVHAQARLLNQVCWTVPTLVGKTMYVRDTQQILAVDLG